MRFIEEHWGDLIGLLLLYTGIALALCAATRLEGAQAVTHLGESLVLAGMGVLRFRGKSKANGDRPQKDHANDSGSEAPAINLRPASKI